MNVVITKLLVTQPFDRPPIECEKIQLMLDGIKHDRHHGLARLAMVRERKLVAKGTQVLNLRQVTIVSEEELQYISNEVGEEVTSEDLQANITLKGYPNLTQLTPGAFIKTPRNAIIYVTAENFPCVIPAQNMMKRGMAKEKAIKFSKCAYGKRGITGIIYSAGYAKVGEQVEIVLPGNLE